jgi:hypothetical protein
MRTVKLALALILLAAPTWAQSGPLSKVADPRAQVGVNGGCPAVRKALKSHSLFLRTGELPNVGWARTLDLELTLDGAQVAAERFQLAAGDAGNIEILSRNPALLERIYTLAAKAGPRLIFAVRLDGRVVREMTFQDLVAENGRTRLGVLKPMVLKSQVTDPAPELSFTQSVGRNDPAVTKGYSYDPACVDDCYAQYANCDDSNICNSCPTCSEQQSACITSCPQTCTDPASVYDRQETQLVGAQAVDYNCYEDYFENDFVHGHYYTTYYLTFKTSTIRRTYYCNGSYTDEVINVSYSNGYCSNQEFWTCDYPWSWPPAGWC